MAADSFMTGIEFDVTLDVERRDELETEIVFRNFFTAKADSLLAGRAKERFDVPGDPGDR